MSTIRASFNRHNIIGAKYVYFLVVMLFSFRRRSAIFIVTVLTPLLVLGLSILLLLLNVSLLFVGVFSFGSVFSLDVAGTLTGSDRSSLTGVLVELLLLLRVSLTSTLLF